MTSTAASAPALQIRASVALPGFAVAVFLFHHLPAMTGEVSDWIDLFTPFVVISTAAALLLALRAPAPVLVVAFVAAILYVDGHGIHLSANSIGHQHPVGDVERVRHFWDERFGHIEWHLGWFGLMAAFCAAEYFHPAPISRRAVAVTAVLLGWTLFASTVEGGTWPLALAAGAGFCAWAIRVRRSLPVAIAASFALAAVLMGAYAIWQGGMPEFSDAGLL